MRYQVLYVRRAISSRVPLLIPINTYQSEASAGASGHTLVAEGEKRGRGRGKKGKRGGGKREREREREK